MPTYSYRAKSGPNNIVDGVLEAPSQEEAVSRIIQSGYTPLDVIAGERTPRSVRLQETKLRLQWTKRVPLPAVSLFFRQGCDLLEAGVPLLRSLELLAQQCTQPQLKPVMERMGMAVREGGSLSDALGEHPAVFPALAVNMIRAGEISGNLVEVFERLAQFTERDVETRAQVKSSLMYPAFILGVGALTMFVLLTFVLPRLAVMFEDFDAELPLATRLIIGVSDFFARYWWGIISSVVLLGIYLKNFFQSPQGAAWKDEILLRIPLLGNFFTQVELARFARTLGTLLDSGVSILPALECTSAILDNSVLKKQMQKVTQQVREGSSLTGALKLSPLFSDMTASMVAVGEESGRLHKGLFKLAETCERQTAAIMSDFLTLLGPVVLVCIVTAVGAVVVAMLLPIFRMNLIIH